MRRGIVLVFCIYFPFECDEGVVQCCLPIIHSPNINSPFFFCFIFSNMLRWIPSGTASSRHLASGPPNNRKSESLKVLASFER